MFPTQSAVATPSKEAAKTLVQTLNQPASTTATTPVEIKPAVTETPISASDILKRTGEISNQPATQDPLKEGIPQLNLDDVKDPVARKLLEEKYRQWETGFNKKFEKFSEERKQLQAEMEKLKQPQDWNPERVNQLLSDPKFIESAKAVAQTRAPQGWEGTDDQWSSLAPQEKQAFGQMQSQLQTLMLQQSQMQVKQIDEQIKSRFSDYDPDQINSFAAKYDRGEVDTAQLRELVHKGMSFERAVENAYKLGLKDRNGNLSEKINASSSFGNGAVTTSQEVPTVKEGEKHGDFLKRALLWNLSQSKQGKK